MAALKEWLANRESSLSIFYEIDTIKSDKFTRDKSLFAPRTESQYMVSQCPTSHLIFPWQHKGVRTCHTSHSVVHRLALHWSPVPTTNNIQATYACLSYSTCCVVLLQTLPMTVCLLQNMTCQIYYQYQLQCRTIRRMQVWQITFAVACFRVNPKC